MDVILLKEVERLGAEGTLAHVKPGLARNFLIPRGLAVQATPQQRQALEERKRQRSQKAERAKTEAQALRQKIESLAVTLKLSLGDEEKAFGSVTVHDLVAAMKRDGLEIEKHAIQLDHPIKALGSYQVPVRVHPEVTATLKVLVVKA